MDVRTQNVTAVMSIANIVKTSLGPVGLDKVGVALHHQYDWRIWTCIIVNSAGIVAHRCFGIRSASAARQLKPDAELPFVCNILPLCWLR